VLATLIFYTLIYGALIVAEVYLLVKFAKAGPADDVSPIDAAGEPDASQFGDLA
jgi:cytochrome bd-type quinol oxidase subunit 1